MNSKNMISLAFVSLISCIHCAYAQDKTLIGRCSFDPRTNIFNNGAFRSGNALANFYALIDAQGARNMIVTEGIAKTNGFIADKTELADDGWPRYAVTFSNPGVPFQASWIDDEARAANPGDPKKSIIGYDNPSLNEIRSVPANGSFLQNKIVRVPNAYPNCIFWSIPAPENTQTEEK